MRSTSRLLTLSALLAAGLAVALAPQRQAAPLSLPAAAAGADTAGLGTLATPALALELAHQRLKTVGLASADAREIVDLVARGASFEVIDARIDRLLEPAAAIDGQVVARVLEEQLRSPRAGTPAQLATAMGMADEIGLDAPAELRARRAGAGAARLGMALVASQPSPAPTPSFNGTCQSCPNFDFGCFTPTGSWQTHASALGPALGDCNWYCFDVVSGTTYEFSTCSDVGGAAAFDTVLDVFQPPAAPGPCVFKTSNDDNCAPTPLSSHVTWTADFTGSVRVRVRGKGGAAGDYTLAYRKICPAASSCASPDGTLVPTTSCQYQSGSVDDCSDDRWYEVSMVAGRTYTFDLGCPGCPLSYAAFDSSVELWVGGTPQVSSSTCPTGGDDGGFRFTPTVDTLGCIRVHREGGSASDFSLGYKVECQEPSDVAISPDSASTVAADCTRDQRFTVVTSGTPNLTYDWTITPPSGGSATPASGSTTSALETASFTSLLQGSGIYVVTVTVSNECGSATQAIDFVLEDRAGPELTTSADAVDCGGPVPIGPRRTPILGRRAPVSERQIMQALWSSPDPSVVQADIARKLGVSAAQVRVIDSTDPGYLRPPGAAAVSCPTPCTGFGNLTATHPYYDVALDCDNGAFTARTGASHSVTVSSGTPQNVIFGGAALNPGTSDVTFHVHDTGDNFLDPTGGRTCVFNPADTAVEPASVGVESEWTKNIAGGRQLTLREEIVAFGSTESNSGIRLTLAATNAVTSSSPVSMGVRWQIDYQNAGDDGPHYAQVLCGPPFEVINSRSTEHEFTPAEVAAQDFYRIRNNTGSPIFDNFTETTPLAGFPDTGKPDRLVYGRWTTMNASPWNYVTSPGSDADFDSAVLYYFGYAPADGIVIAPGESFSRSVIIFTAGNAQDCGSFRPGTCDDASVEICPGDCASVGATATDNCTNATVSLIGSSPGAPPCVGNPCVISFPDEGTYVYTWQAVDEAGNTAECTSTVVVANGRACNQPPTCAAGGPYASSCHEAQVDGASVEDINDDPISYTWTSDRADVVITPSSGVLPGAPGARTLPPVVATLDPATAPCGVTANLTLTVNDGLGGESSCVTSVTFSDTEAPTLSPVSDVTAECDAVPPPPPMAALDACDPNPSLNFTETRTDGACPGEYVLERTWSSTDACGNLASARQVVTVVDTTPPKIVAEDELLACLWPPNHWYVGFTLADLRVEVQDTCSEPVTFELSGCISDQPDDARETDPTSEWNGDGHTEQDCVVSPDGQTLYVRAERCGTGPTAQDGRHYKVTVVATDACGNSTGPTPAGTIHVPHDQSPTSRGCRNPTQEGIRELP